MRTAPGRRPAAPSPTPRRRSSGDAADGGALRRWAPRGGRPMTPLTVERFVGGRAAEAKDVLALAQEHGVRMVDFKFTDLPGTWQHLGLSIHALDEEAFAEGLGFDGSSIRGFQEIAESDMVLLPDPASALIDPFHEQKTLSVLCDVIDPITREPYSRDPRYVALKAERYGTQNLGYKIRSQQGYFPTAPGDTHGDLRARMVVALESMGLRCEFQHHEVGSAGQAENNGRFNTLRKMADQIQLQKYVIKNVANQAGKTATFMPKPLFEENGSGMHVHMSLGRGGENLMFDFDGYAQLSREALNFIGGILAHGRALMAFCAPTTNSYRRLVPGYEAPVNLVYSQRNRSAACRIPVYSASPKSKRVEFRPPDPSANPYLAFSALLMAGLDGIQNRLDPGQPVDVDLFELPEEQLRDIKHVPSSLDEALDALEADHEFLLKGGVFTQDLIDTWIGWKRREEADQVRMRPHPWEFALYYDS